MRAEVPAGSEMCRHMSRPWGKDREVNVLFEATQVQHGYSTHWIGVTIKRPKVT